MNQSNLSWLDVPLPSRLSVPGSDARGLRPDLEVAEGDVVSAGQTLVRDRKRPWVRITSPAPGTVRAIRLGPRRSLDAVELEPDGSPRPTSGPRTLPDDPAVARQALVEAGIWGAIRSRPFDDIADPSAEPRAVVVTGYLSDHAAPGIDLFVSEGADAADFRTGLEAVAGLAGCGAVLAHPGFDPVSDLSAGAIGKLAIGWRAAERSPGQLVRRLGPATLERPIWHLSWQDVLGIGRWLRCGEVSATRIVSYRGRDTELRLLRATVGTPLEDLAETLGVPAAGLVLGHPALARRAAALGRHDDRLSRLQTPFAPAFRPRPGPILPLPRLEAALPGMPAPVAFLRALAAGDIDRARRFGVLDMGPEDVATCALLCVSGNDYPALLARMLDRIEEEWR